MFGIRRKIDVGLLASLLAVLAMVCAWSARWAVDDLRTETFGVEGDVTTVVVEAAAPISEPDAPSAEGLQLRDYLYDKQIPMIAAPQGNGRPVLLAGGPVARVPWLRSTTEPFGIYAIDGSYTARQWAAGRNNPLLPSGARVEGAVVLPNQAAGLQYVEIYQGRPLRYGSLVLGTKDPVELSEIRELLDKQGLVVREGSPADALRSVAENPFVAISVILLALGAAVVMISLVSAVRDHAREISIRRLYGATSRGLLAGLTKAALPFVILGNCVAAYLVGLTVALAGSSGLDRADVLTIVFGFVLSLASWGLVWTGAVWHGLRHRGVR